MTGSIGRGLLATLLVLAFVAPGGVAYALWSSTSTATVSVSIASAAPAAPSVSCSGSGASPTLTWTAITGATSYRVYRSASPLGAAKKTVQAPATSVALVESDMGTPTNQNQKYDVIVKAVNSSGESGPSNVFTIQFKPNGLCAG